MIIKPANVMASRVREKVERLFEVFVEIAKPNGKDEAPFIIKQYPPDYDDKEALSMIPQFAYPCPTDASQVDHFTFVLTDLDSMFRFGFCRHTTGHQTCLCIVSWLPWFEIFYKLLDFMAEVTNRSEKNNLNNLLRATFNHEIPSPRTSVTIVANENMFSFTTPDVNVLPSIPSSRNLTEYYSAVDPYNMMVIFASMLHERRIYMTSRKLSRLTACIHAAEMLLYPMHWQHLYIPVLPARLIDYVSAPMPYLIGVHSNLIEKMKNRVDVADAVVVDLDANTVTTEYDDLGDLPENVSNYLKRNLKTDVVKNSMKTGDAISVAFLHTLVRLIGGYRDALKFRAGEPITFDPEAFVRSRSSQSTQTFLESMLGLQIFQQFIYGRLEILNSGAGFRDLFEQQAILYADKLNSQSKYKEWLKSVKKSGKKGWHGLKVKAAPMMSTAMHSMKAQGKRAMADFKTKFSGMADNEDKKGSSQQDAKEVTHEKSSKKRPATAHAENMSRARPPRPPPPTRATQVEYEKSRVKPALHAQTSQDDGQLHLNYQSVDMSLMTDSDIQAAMLRSTSDGMIRGQSKQQNSNDESDSDSCDSSDEVDKSHITLDVFHSSSEGLNSATSSDESLTKQHQRTEKTSKTGDRLIFRDSSYRSLHPGANQRITTLPSRSLHPSPSPMAHRTIVVRSSKLELPKSSIKDEKMTAASSKTRTTQNASLINSRSFKSDRNDKFDQLNKSLNETSNIVSSTRSESMDDGYEVDMRVLDRNITSRVSLTRSKAFRRDAPAVPLRTYYLDDDDIDGPVNDTSKDDIFDIPSEIKKLTLSSSNGRVSMAQSSDKKPHPIVNYPSSSLNQPRDSSDLLNHEWSLASLAKGPSIKMPITSQPPVIHSSLGTSQNMHSAHQFLPQSSKSSTMSKGTMNSQSYVRSESGRTLNPGFSLDRRVSDSSQSVLPNLRQSSQIVKSSSPKSNQISAGNHATTTQRFSTSLKTPETMNVISPTPSSSTPIIHGRTKHILNLRSSEVNSSLSSSSSGSSLQKRSDSLSDVQDVGNKDLPLDQLSMLKVNPVSPS